MTINIDKLVYGGAVKSNKDYYWYDEPEPAIDFLDNEGFIQDKAVTMLLGQPGAGKSFIAIDLAIQMADKGNSVLYMAFEGLASVRKRFKGRISDAFSQYGQVRAEIIASRIDIVGDSGSDDKYRAFFDQFTHRTATSEIAPRDLDLLLTRKAFTKQDLIDSRQIPPDSPMPDNILAIVPYDVAIVDTAIATWTHIDENNANEVRKVLQPFDRWVDRNKTAFIYIHHEGKDSQKGARGSSDWTAFASNILSLIHI